MNFISEYIITLATLSLVVLALTSAVLAPFVFVAWLLWSWL